MHILCEPCAQQGGLSELNLLIANYDNIQLLWETALQATWDTGTRARIHGVRSPMQSYNFLFCPILSEVILQHTGKLSETLQQPELSCVEGC